MCAAFFIFFGKNGKLQAFVEDNLVIDSICTALTISTNYQSNIATFTDNEYDSSIRMYLTEGVGRLGS